jgi:hypothetical protein
VAVAAEETISEICEKDNCSLASVGGCSHPGECILNNTGWLCRPIPRHFDLERPDGDDESNRLCTLGRPDFAYRPFPDAREGCLEDDADRSGMKLVPAKPLKSSKVSLT